MQDFASYNSHVRNKKLTKIIKNTKNRNKI